MDEVCQNCGKIISRRMKANIWDGERVVCTACLHVLQGAVVRRQVGVRLAGQSGADWLIYDGSRQSGPYPTQRLIEMLRGQQVRWEWHIWREGMEKWKPAMSLFTIPELADGRLELRDFGQGDGTYRPGVATS